MLSPVSEPNSIEQRCTEVPIVSHAMAYQLGSPEVGPNREENVMKKISVIAATLVGGAVLCAAPISQSQAYGYRHHPYAAAQAAAPGQVTCKEAAKLQFPNERHMRKAFKKECKQAYKASRGTARAS